MCELPNGDLVATYFGGTKERNPDCCIWVSRKPKGATNWSAPILAAHGKMPFEEMNLTKEEIMKEGKNGEITLSDSRKAAWNPVIYYNKTNKKLEIYFKLGINPRDWDGWIVRSSDGGKSWSKREQLPKGILGPVKNKIFEDGTRLIAPTSLEEGGWRIYFELSDDGGKTWRKTADVDAPLTEAPAAEAGKKVNAIQPAILKLDDGRLAAVARTRSERVGISFSDDKGETWSKLQLLSVPNNNSGLDAVTLQNPIDGGYKHIMICNDYPVPPGIKSGKGLRTPLSLLRSKDGINWEHWLTLEDSPISQYSYPSIIQTKDGNIHCIYTWRRQRIKHVEITTEFKE
ncbi:MAG: exo-alpha-sialidase [Bacteroidaceae bacterium]|nr:exo-alpha-sialidase [Bacteroidaceae bacterium]